MVPAFFALPLQAGRPVTQKLSEGHVKQLRAHLVCVANLINRQHGLSSTGGVGR